MAVGPALSLRILHDEVAELRTAPVTLMHGATSLDESGNASADVVNIVRYCRRKSVSTKAWYRAPSAPHFQVMSVSRTDSSNAPGGVRRHDLHVRHGAALVDGKEGAHTARGYSRTRCFAWKQGCLLRASYNLGDGS